MESKIAYRFNTSILLIIAIFFFSCTNKTNEKGGKLKGNITISGAFALYPITVRWAEEFHKVYPDVFINVSAGGAGKGIMDALSGMVDIGMVSRSISKSEEVKGAWFIGVVKDAVLPTINGNNPYLPVIRKNGFTKAQFTSLFITGAAKTWNDLLNNKASDRVNIYSRSDACGAAEIWGKYLGMNQESLLGVGVFGDPGIADAVKNDKNGIGYNNVIYIYDLKTRKVYDGLEVIPLDLNEDGIIDSTENFYTNLDTILKAIQNGKYPSPPARDLYFVTHGKPKDPIVIEFIEWVLNEGQKYVTESGYVQLANDAINENLKKLK